MASVLESHLALLEREAEVRMDSTGPERARLLEDVVSLHTAVYEAIERRIAGEGLTEADRPLVPLFRRWLSAARRILQSAGELRSQGQRVHGLDELLRAINRAKPAADDFDQVVAVNRRTASHEPGTHRPLGEVLDELRAQP